MARLDKNSYKLMDKPNMLIPFLFLEISKEVYYWKQNSLLINIKFANLGLTSSLIFALWVT